MLKSIKLAGVGPADEMTAELAPRINVITGDNGLGKSFLLDVAWWALTRTWTGSPALPGRHAEVATIGYVVADKGAKNGDLIQSQFRFDTQTWPVTDATRPKSGIVVYARVDGGFSVWDPARNYSQDNGIKRPTAYHFDSSQVFDGLDLGGMTVCEGLERDWVGWQRARAPEFEWLRSALISLSAPDEPIEPGEPVRVFVGEGRDRPTIRANGRDVPIVLASAGVRRVLALAYLLVWAWREHKLEVELQRLGAPERRLVLLIDEPETHLHPRWQRSILPSSLRAADELRSEGAETQVIAATHSPLVLASLEPVFDASTDAWFDLDRVQKDGPSAIELSRRTFVRRGGVSRWLTSEAFDLGSEYGIEAERAITEARALLRQQEKAATVDVENADLALRRVLGDTDPFWVRWSAFVDRRKGAA